MKFPRMAHNSLFAVLLRSPWWISFLVAAAVAALAQALAPREYRNLASMGAFPFVVIGAIALYRQWGRPSAEQVRARLDLASRVSWPQLEAALREGYGREGWTVEAGSGAVDLVLRQGGRTLLVGARRWKAARLGEDALQALRQAVRERDASGAIVVTLGELSRQATAFAAANGIDVLQGERLAVLLGDLPAGARPAGARR